MKRVVFVLAMFAVCVQAEAGKNFRCDHAVYAERAEDCRRELGIFWTGEPLRNWAKPCTIHARLIQNRDDYQHHGGGVTSFAFDRGEVHSWRMTIEGPHDRLIDAVIPHEVNHTVMATLTRRPIPRWLDEGTSQIFEHPAAHTLYREQARTFIDHQASAWRYLDRGDYPDDMNSTLALYATGFTVVEWMLEKEGRETLLEFITDSRKPSQKFDAYYGVSPADAEREWRAWMKDRPDDCDGCGCYMHGHRTAAKVPQHRRGQPTLFAVGNDLCIACVPFRHDYNWRAKFRTAIWERANVVFIDGMKYQAWLSQLGIYGWPAFVLRINDQDYVVAKSYPGREALIAAMDRVLRERGAEQSVPLLETQPPVEAPVTAVPSPPKATDQPKDTTDGVEETATPASESGVPSVRENEPAPMVPDVPRERTDVTPATAEEGGINWKGLAFDAALVAAGAFTGGVPIAYALARRFAAPAAKHVAGKFVDRVKEKRERMAQPPGWNPPASSSPPDPPPAPPTIPNPPEQCRYREPASNPPPHIQPNPTPSQPQQIQIPPGPRPQATHITQSEFVPFDDGRFRGAYEEAIRILGKRYPGQIHVFDAQRSIIEQIMAGQSAV